MFNPKAASSQIAIADLAGEEWISGGTGVPNRVCLEQAALSAGFQPHVAYQTRDYQVTLALIDAGLGISLVPASVLGGASPDRLAIRGLSEASPARDIYLVHRKRSARLVTDMIATITGPAGP